MALKRFGVLFLWCSLSFGAHGGHGHVVHHGGMGSVAVGHGFHGYPASYPGYRHGYYAAVPWAFWTGYGYGYSYGPVYGYGHRFGAFAYSKTTGKFGWAANFPTQWGAQNEAMNNCSAAATDCINLMWFADTCAALATSTSDKSHYGWAWTANASIARANAQTECSKYAPDCVVKAHICSY